MKVIEMAMKGKMLTCRYLSSSLTTLKGNVLRSVWRICAPDIFMYFHPPPPKKKELNKLIDK